MTATNPYPTTEYIVQHAPCTRPRNAELGI